MFNFKADSHISARTMVVKGKKSYQAIIRDITARKPSVEALRREKYFAESLIKTAQTIVLVLDTSGCIVNLNPYMEEISGYQLKEVQGKDWFSTFLPERDRKQTRELFLSAVAYIQTRGNVNPIVTKDGREVYIEWYDKTLKNEKGNVVGLLAIGQDITERKRGEEALQEREEKYRSLAASVDSMYLVDRDCTYLFMNEGHRMRFGLPLEEIIGRRYGEFHSEGDTKEFADCIREVSETGKPIIKEHRSERDGRHFLRTFTPIMGRSPVGEILKVVIVSKDITKRKQAEKDLIETVQQLQETRDMLIQFEKEAAVGRLAAGVAHELLNPVSIISSRLQFLEEENLSEPARENVRVSREQLQRIVKISQDLHQSSAIQPRPHVSGDLRDVIELSLKMTESRIREDQVCVVYHPPPAIIPVKMERYRMSKVMVHLILNACDALLNTDQKRLIITVQYPIATDKPSSVLLIVADNGCGVSKGDMNRIFDPFFTTKDPGKGTGLGLSVCEGIIHEHGGTIRAENNDMRGASFIVELPLYDQ
jgi:PAS domain S-box-containing protein